MGRLLSALLFIHNAGGTGIELQSERESILRALAPLVVERVRAEYGLSDDEHSELLRRFGDGSLFVWVDAQVTSRVAPSRFQGLNRAFVERVAEMAPGRDVDRRGIMREVEVALRQATAPPAAGRPEGELRDDMLGLLANSHERVRAEEGAGGESGVADVGVRSGASIEVAHTFRREGDPHDAVVTVAYRHLFRAAPSGPGPIARGDPLGEARGYRQRAGRPRAHGDRPAPRPPARVAAAAGLLRAQPAARRAALEGVWP